MSATSELPDNSTKNITKVNQKGHKSQLLNQTMTSTTPEVAFFCTEAG